MHLTLLHYRIFTIITLLHLTLSSSHTLYCTFLGVNCIQFCENLQHSGLDNERVNHLHNFTITIKNIIFNKLLTTLELSTSDFNKSFFIGKQLKKLFIFSYIWLKNN